MQSGETKSHHLICHKTSLQITQVPFLTDTSTNTLAIKQPESQSTQVGREWYVQAQLWQTPDKEQLNTTLVILNSAIDDA